MHARQISRVRAVLLFVIIWLLAAGAVQAFHDTVIWAGGLVVVAVTSLLVFYCRWQARRGLPAVKRPWKSYFWMAIPSVPALLSVAGIAWSLTHPDPNQPRGQWLWDALPVFLQFGVPLLGLGLVYVWLTLNQPPLHPCKPGPGPDSSPSP